jgi:hypothetical protein
MCTTCKNFEHISFLTPQVKIGINKIAGYLSPQCNFASTKNVLLLQGNFSLAVFFEGPYGATF